MSRRSLLVLLVVAGGALAVLRRRAQEAARVDVFSADGSMQSLERGSPQAERMLLLAGEAIEAVRSAR